MQVFTVTGLFAGQHNTRLHGWQEKNCNNPVLNQCWRFFHSQCFLQLWQSGFSHLGMFSSTDVFLLKFNQQFFATCILLFYFYRFTQSLEHN